MVFEQKYTHNLIRWVKWDQIGRDVYTKIQKLLPSEEQKWWEASGHYWFTTK